MLPPDGRTIASYAFATVLSLTSFRALFAGFLYQLVTVLLKRDNFPFGWPFFSEIKMIDALSVAWLLQIDGKCAMTPCSLAAMRNR